MLIFYPGHRYYVHTHFDALIQNKLIDFFTGTKKNKIVCINQIVFFSVRFDFCDLFRNQDIIEKDKRRKKKTENSSLQFNWSQREIFSLFSYSIYCSIVCTAITCQTLIDATNISFYSFLFLLSFETFVKSLLSYQSPKQFISISIVLLLFLRFCAITKTLKLILFFSFFFFSSFFSFYLKQNNI